MNRSSTLLTLQQFRGLVLLLAIFAGTVRAAIPADPKTQAQSVYAEIKADLSVSVANSLVDQYFDLHAMAIHSLGLPYRQFTTEQRTAYVEAFDNYFKRSFYNVLTAYKDVTIVNLDSRVEGDRTIVRCVVKTASGPSINLALDFTLENNIWKADDVVVDNVSLILSYRPQFESLYQKRGFSGLVAFLNGT